MLPTNFAVYVQPGGPERGGGGEGSAALRPSRLPARTQEVRLLHRRRRPLQRKGRGKYFLAGWRQTNFVIQIRMSVPEIF